jgi:hypothetical protein
MRYRSHSSDAAPAVSGIAIPAVDGPVRGEDRVAIYRILLDERTAIVRTDVRGFWEPGDAVTYFDHLARFIDAARYRHGFARVLVDRRENPVQSAKVAEQMRSANVRLYRPEDRLAIVTGSRLVQMQMRRLISHAGSRAFLTLAEAEVWLACKADG